MELSVIIVNYNGLRHLKACFDSLYDKLEGVRFEIVVLDNNSADGSCAYIREQYPQVRLIESRENLGFGRGNNAAVEQAQGEYLLLINNDTIVQDQLAPALEVVKNDSSIGAAGIKMLDGEGRYLPSVGRFPNPMNMLQIKKVFSLGPEFKSGHFSKPLYEADWLGGAFLIIPRKVYDAVQGFDDDYFMYVEDVDLCKKIADKGYRRVFLPGFSYIHFVGFGKGRNKLLIIGCRLYVNKHLSGFNKWASLAALHINNTVKSIKSILDKD